MPYKLAVFDMDGTILNSLHDIFVSLNHALAETGLPEITFPQCRSYVGNGIRKLIERAVPPGTDAAHMDRVHAAFTAHYRIHCSDTTRPYDGIIETLKKLRADGWKTAVVSNKPDYGVQELCRLHFDGLFDAATGERPGYAKKPAPDLVDMILKMLGTARSEAVYIGDSEVDVATAAQAGMDAVIVTWGFREEEALRAAGAKTLADTPEALYRLLDAGFSN